MQEGKADTANRRDESRRRLPPWLRRPMPSRGMLDTRKLLNGLRLHTVCAEAKCPNLTECWGRGTATFMVLGDACTRNCRFCAVKTSASPPPPELDEPQRLAQAAARLKLRHVVVTSVTRDDLPDEGAGHFAQCVRAIHEELPEASVEVLTPDFHARPELLRTVCESVPQVYNHNLETVERLQKSIRPDAAYKRSLNALGIVREISPQMRTKSGLMVGLGETTAEIVQALRDLRSVDCDLLTIGQYLKPASDRAPVQKYYRPEEFDELAGVAEGLGFQSVASGPFVRSSYFAESMHLKEDL